MAGLKYQQVIEDGKLSIEEIYKVIVYRFSITSVDDHVVSAAEPLYNWEKSEAGKFIKENTLTPATWQYSLSVSGWNYDYIVIAELTKKKYSEFLLRFGKDGNH